MLTGRARAAVLGSPIAHSLSPVLHRAAYVSLGLDWRYDAVDVADAAGLAAFVEVCDREGGWAGLSLTMPLKRVVQPLLDEVTEAALSTAAVNTVVFEPDVGGPADARARPRRVGHNTDVPGIVAALGEAGIASLDDGVVLGGGATACSAVAALSRLGAAQVRVVVRSPERSGDVLTTAQHLGAHVELLPWADLLASPDHARDVLTAGAVVSTVPAQAADQVVRLLELSQPRGVLLDVVYDPWPTPVAQAWERLGGTSVGGFAMLLHQAVDQVRLMSGRAPDVEAMRAAGLAALSRRR